MTDIKDLKIARLGAGGDGIAEGDGDDPLYVPFTLPGEHVRAILSGARGRLVEILDPAPERVAPACAHFTKCGGCATQHLDQQTYKAWKAQLVTSALAKKAISANIDDLVCVGHGARRRATLVGRYDPFERRVALGFHEQATHTLIDIAECPVLADDIVTALPMLRKFVAPVARHVGELRIQVLRASNGLDIDLSGFRTVLPRALLARVTQDAAKLGALRVTVDQDPVFSSQKPLINCGPAHVVPPPGVFLQASAEAQEKMVALIVSALPKRVKKVADLFCGLGAFTFPLAERTSVSAFDSDVSAINALNEAARHTTGIKNVAAKVRDLFQEPLSRKELADFDAVIFDPPRAGATRQAQNLAKSNVPVVVAVSCNPATFARDARTLLDAGYVLQNVTPIDQFLYAAHVEVVGLFRR